MKGSITRRCYCRDPDTKKPLSRTCPLLKNRDHGTHSLRQELPAREDMSRRSFSRAGYATAKEAQADLDRVRAILALAKPTDSEGKCALGDLLETVASTKVPIPDVAMVRQRLRTGLPLIDDTTTGSWLDTWLAGKKGRPSAITRDEINIRVHLKPRIGHHPLPQLRVSHLSEMFTAIADANEEITDSNALRRAAVDDLAAIPWKGGENRARRKAMKAAIAEMPPFRKTTTALTRQRIKATLRVALNAAITEQLITFNPAAFVKIDPAKRAKALVWTDERVAHWERTGEKPSPVMVWTPTQFGTFLDHAEGDLLYEYFYLLGFRGLRRGEGCGQRWVDVNLKGRRLTVAKQLVVDGWHVYEDDPKTEAGERTVRFDERVAATLQARRVRQDADRKAWGNAWVETGRVFTRENGSLLHPSNVTERFVELTEEAGLPPTRLHDLRHLAATLAHAAGASLRDIQELLGHSSISVTEYYVSVFEEAEEIFAAAVVDMVPRAGSEKPETLPDVDNGEGFPRTHEISCIDQRARSAHARPSGRPSSARPRRHGQR